ncbi:uncharacterized protein LOC134695223 [Mytilus trossulus]|uniref:uncharacterized protein LOC134695223 n=1 Tax=Mytilus trossulus TaxID=6551 RepID=UPI003007D77D
MVCLFCVVAYLYQCIRVLNGELEHRSSIIDALKLSQEELVMETEQEKFKLEELRTKISTITLDNLELRENIFSNNFDIKSFDETFEDMRNNLLSLQNKVEFDRVNNMAIRRQIDKSIIKTKIENIKKMEDLNATIARIQTEAIAKAIEDNNLQTDKKISEFKTEILRELKDAVTSLEPYFYKFKVEIEKIEKQYEDFYMRELEEFEKRVVKNIVHEMINNIGKM